MLSKLSESRAAYSEGVPWSVSEGVRRLHLRTRSTDAEDKNKRARSGGMDEDVIGR